MNTYKNPWHNPQSAMYGPVMYSTDTKPVEYRGYLIYNRILPNGISGSGVWDVVKDGVCVSQHAGPNGARSFIDSLVTT